MKNIKAVAILIVLALGAWFSWSQYDARRKAEKDKEEAEQQLGLEAARLINAKFESSAELKVRSFSGTGIGKAEYKGTIFTPTQITSVPFSINYYLDLRKVRPGSFRWDERTSTLSIDLPDVTVGKPNIDMSLAVIKQSGPFISREAGIALNRTALGNIRKKVEADASAPAMMNKARADARAAVVTFARSTLQGGGLSNAKVAVSFPWEPKMGNSLAERWDVTRSIPDVMADKK